MFNFRKVKKKVYIAGDHSKYHCGSWAVMNYLKTEVGRRHEIVKDPEIADIVVVNGEGTMHDNSKGFFKKMAVLEEAKSFGKKAFLLNSVWQNNGGEFDSLLRRLDGIIVREKASQRDLFHNHGVDSEVCIDLSYFCDLDFGVNYRDLSGSRCYTDFYSEDFGGWVKYTGGANAKFPYLWMKDFSWSSFVMTLKTSSLLVTGRHHAVFAAARAEIPFVAMESNTHKISGFVRMANIPIPVCKTPRELSDAVKWALTNPNAYSEFFEFMREQPKLSFTSIGL